MKTVIEVKSLKDVRQAMNDLYPPKTLTCKYALYDDRIDWDTWMILGDDIPVGYSDGELK